MVHRSRWISSAVDRYHHDVRIGVDRKVNPSGFVDCELMDDGRLSSARESPHLRPSKNTQRHGVICSVFRWSQFPFPFAKPCEIHPPATMVPDSDTATHLRAFRFDGSFLELGPEEEAFFKAKTGIQYPEELRKHVIEAHEEAYKVSTRFPTRWSSETWQ